MSNQGRKGNIKDSRVLRSKVTRRKSLKNFLLFSFLSERMFYVGANRIANSISAKYLLASNFDFQIFSLINWQSTVLFSAIPAFEFKENICSSRMEVNFVATKSESIFRKKISAKNGSIPVKYASVQNCWFELKAAFCIFMHRTYPNSIF